MEKIFEKLSSYHLLNYIIPGSIFSIFVSEYFAISLEKYNIAEQIVIFYFLGLIISRIGSLLFEPLYKKLKIVEYSFNKDYYLAEKKDELIHSLLEVNNLYRTCIAMLALILLCFPAKCLYNKFAIPKSFVLIIIILLLLIIFSLSYRKQTNAIKNRVDFSKNN